MKKRLLEVDLLRGLAVLSALPVHFDAVSATALTQGFVWFNRLYLNIAIVFFLVSGFMGKWVYERKLKKDFTANRNKLIIKGVQILAIYLVVTLILSLMGGNDIQGLDYLLLSHPYFLKVYVPLAIMFLMAPYLIKALDRVKDEWVLLAIGLGMMLLTEPVSKAFGQGVWQTLIVDYDPYLHPLLPMMGVYVVGYLLAKVYTKILKSAYVFWGALVVVASYYHVILRYVAENVGFGVTNILFLKLLIVVAIFIVLGFVVRGVGGLCEGWWKWMLIPGQGSLIFFTSINVLVPLFEMSGWVKEGNELLLMVLIGGLSYMFTVIGLRVSGLKVLSLDRG